MRHDIEPLPARRIWKANGAAAIVFACLLAACGGGGDTATPAPVPTPSSVQAVAPGPWVIIGSSTAAGAGASEGMGWVSLVQAAYSGQGAQIVNLAKGGSVTYAGLGASASRPAGRPASDPAANIDAALARRPVLVLVSYPTNDTALGYSVDETVNNLLAIRSQALAAGVPVIITSTQPRNLSEVQLAQLRMIDARMASSIGACFVDVREALAGADGRLAPGYDSGDGVHPNGLGHQLVATYVQTLINSKKCVSTSAP